MANQTVYPYGMGGSLPSSIGVINDLTTGGADKALSAEQGKVINERFITDFWQNSSSVSWATGNIANGVIVSTYANKYTTINNFPAGVSQLFITRNAPDSTYELGIFGTSDNTNYTSLGYFNTSQTSAKKTITITGYTKILFLLWDKPTTQRAQEEGITISYVDTNIVLQGDVSNTVFGESGIVPSVDMFRQMADDLWLKTLAPGTADFYWEQGGLNGSTGAEETNTMAIRSNWISVRNGDQVMVPSNEITNYTFFCVVYDENKTRLGNITSFGTFTTKLKTLLSTHDTGYIRLCYYGGYAISPTNTDAAKTRIILTVGDKTSSSGPTAVENYENPVLRADKPDPTIWDGEDGYFYLYATGNFSNNRMYRSANLYEWELTGDAPMNDTEALKVATAFGASSISQGFWAPHVYKINPTTWNLYITKPAGGIAILTSHHPTRGYEYIKFISRPSGAGEFIDAEIGYDTDGKVWMYTGGEYSIYRREMTADGLDWAEGSSFERCAGLAYNASGNTYREKTFEGPYLYRRKGYWYLFCSSGLYAQGNYKLRVVRSQTLGGTWVDKSGNDAADGYAETVLISGGTLTGPGHNAPIFVDSNNNNWILYHSHWSGFQSSSTRGVCLDKVEWDNDGWPFINDGKPSISHEAPAYFR